MRKFQYVAQEDAVGFRILAVNDRVRAGYHDGPGAT
jgi:hypothetical protein